MAGYFEEMGWAELQEGQQPNHLLDMARFLIDFGFYNEDMIGEWPRYLIQLITSLHSSVERIQSCCNASIDCCIS